MAEELIKVPDIGGAEGAEVVEVLIAVGDRIDLEQSLIVVESDKASMEIPASAVGTVTEVRVAVGDAVSEGDVILTLAAEGASSASTPEQTPSEGDSPPSVDAIEDHEAGPTPSTEETGDDADIAPSVELGDGGCLSVSVPDLGSDQGADLVEILVPAGTVVAEGDSLVLLESDKAAMELPAPAGGVITEWLVSVGDTVQEGTVIATLQLSEAATSQAVSDSGTA